MPRFVIVVDPGFAVDRVHDSPRINRQARIHHQSSAATPANGMKEKRAPGRLAQGVGWLGRGVGQLEPGRLARGVGWLGRGVGWLGRGVG